jgi:hypothetical protein
MNTPDERILDVRWLEPPEPLERTLEAVEAMPRGEHLHLLIHRLPHMLYPILEAWGFAHRTDSNEDGTYEIMIWHHPPENPTKQNTTPA